MILIHTTCSWRVKAALLPPISSLDITNYFIYGHFSYGWVLDLFSV